MLALTTHVPESLSFQTTHPWLTFTISLESAPPSFWMAVGECQSKCEHLAGMPLAPQIDKHLHQVYLAKGVAATTAIEGNTLSEEQVLQHIQGELRVPPSQEYLKQEIDNIIQACNLILREIAEGVQPPLDLARVLQLNKMVLNNLPSVDPDVVPGEIRTYSVGAGTYRGAPAEDCEYLVRTLCEWLDSKTFQPRPGMELPYAIIKATVAHIYLAWIHPFGDGNGRTARLIEVQILLSSGVPSPAAHLLSNYYNKTRTEYYQNLERARTNVMSFLLYAVSGLRDELRDQIATVRQEQWEIAWVNYVHRVFDKLKGRLHDRRKHLILDLSNSQAPVAFQELTKVSPRVAIDYKDRSDRTLLRDLEKLLAMGLVVFDKEAKGWRARRETILAFLPVRSNSSNK